MKTIQQLLVVLMMVVLLIGVSASGQDFSQLVKAVQKVDNNLNQLIEQESAARKQQIAKLNSRIDKLSKAVKNDESSLGNQSTATNAAVVESNLASLLGEIEFLRSEVQQLRAMAGENRQQLASIDDEGFYSSPQSDSKMIELSNRVEELNASLENKLSQPGSGAKPNPSVKHGKIGISAFVHEHFISGPDETSSFVSKRARLAVKGDINDYAQIKIQGEFAKSPKLLDGQLTISPHQQWSLSVGQYKPPFGTDFLISATSTPFVNKSMATSLTTDRDIGATVSFRNKFNSDYALKLTAGLFNGSGINVSDVNNTKNFVARAEVTLGGMFKVAPNMYIGKTNEVDSLKADISDFGGSVTWQWHQEIVEVEYIHSKHDDTKRAGWYVWGGHMFSIGTPFIENLQLLARYEQYDSDLDVGENQVDRLTLGTTLFVDKKYTKIQLNYQINGEQEESVDNNEFLVNFQVAF